MVVVKSRELLEARLGSDGEAGRLAMQAEGDRLDRTTSGKWVRDELVRRLRDEGDDAVVVVDAVRKLNQVNAIRDSYGHIVTHIHLTAPVSVLEARYAARGQRAGEEVPPSYDKVRSNRTEERVETLQRSADVVIDTNRCTESDVFVRAASHLGLYGGFRTGYVDVIVGGQYGSEGKGQIAHYLGREYDLLVRVGGPNAGHKVYEDPIPYTHHQLPSGTRKSNADLLIGAGAVLRPTALLEEIAQCGVEFPRLRIDARAMIISDQDCKDEQRLVAEIGSTGQGVGAATARRILERNKTTLLAGEVPELRPYICSGLDVVSQALGQNKSVCLEGTQGTGLSLYHGEYPYVTSRDTTVSGCLAETGIPPSRVRKVVMVCRTYPIRVGNPADGTSGGMSQEISLAEIAQRSGLPLENLEEAERTSTTNRARRIGEFDWDLLRRAALLNGPTDIALTFADYLSARNGKARRFEQLRPDTINFIQEVERVSGARVSLIATGFNPRSIIDRRTW